MESEVILRHQETFKHSPKGFLVSGLETVFVQPTTTFSIHLQMASTSADRGRNPTPRFTSETKPGGQQQTAKHHSISMPKSWSYRRSLDEPEKFIPGAFPEDDGKHDSAHGAGVHAEHRSWLKTDLPTHEQPSGSRGGVGSLPGPHNARGVAILPDERIHPEGPTTHPLTDECLPTHEHPSGSRIGVGSLPGPNNESGVAILPDERDCDNSKAVPDVPPKDQILVTQSVVVDEQNPIPHPAHSIPGLTQPGSEPGDTIFSATQRAKERDPTFTHGAGVSTSDHPIHESATTIPEQGGDTARHTPTQVGHGASGVIEAVEGVAADVYHGAEHMLHNVEAYFTGGTKPQPDVGRERGGTIRAKNSKSQPVSGDASVNTGLNAAQSQPSQVNPHSQDLPQSMEGMQISGAPTPLPKALQNEYYRAGEYDLYGDKLDTNQFSYDDDISWESGVFAPDVPLGPDGVNERDRASDHARAGYTPSDGCRATRHSLGEGDIAVGYGGVQYNVAGKDGILPGYPTREGMAKLISDRIRDDHLRAAGGAFLSLFTFFQVCTDADDDL
ncbi:hypothetical protein BDZ97DRAFT_118147 [Flammula alnicola]|nr:hypothetical protein BDZ97DRAFT_118147 [Flammula alnicola]